MTGIRVASVGVTAGALIAVLALPAGPALARGGTTNAFTVVRVKVLPDGHALAHGQLNTVVATTALAFRVAVRNESGVARRAKVTLRINRGTLVDPLVVTRTLGLVRPHRTKAVIFSKLGNMAFAQKNNLIVRVSGHAARTRFAVYRVIFALG
ncbi:MAG TPA: hypothetical protein VIL77_02255 [Gaiellaceae bacterium]